MSESFLLAVFNGLAAEFDVGKLYRKHSQKDVDASLLQMRQRNAFLYELVFAPARKFYKRVAGAAKGTAELVQNVCNAPGQNVLTKMSAGG